MIYFFYYDYYLLLYIYIKFLEAHNDLLSKTINKDTCTMLCKSKSYLVSDRNHRTHTNLRTIVYYIYNIE